MPDKQVRHCDTCHWKYETVFYQYYSYGAPAGWSPENRECPACKSLAFAARHTALAKRHRKAAVAWLKKRKGA